MTSLSSICSSRTQGVSTRAQSRQPVVASAVRPVAVWTRPTPDRDADFIKPSYIPTPIQPSITPGRQDSPIYAPVTPEFRPAELPETPKELPNAPRLPERRPDDIPAGNPKEKPGQQGTPDQREAPPSKDRESAPKK